MIHLTETSVRWWKGGSVVSADLTAFRLGGDPAAASSRESDSPRRRDSVLLRRSYFRFRRRDALREWEDRTRTTTCVLVDKQRKIPTFHLSAVQREKKWSLEGKDSDFFRNKSKRFNVVRSSARDENAFVCRFALSASNGRGGRGIEFYFQSNSIFFHERRLSPINEF